MEIIRYWRVIRRWAWLIILCPLLVAVTAGVISWNLPKIYEAQASLLVRPAQPLSPAPGAASLTIDQILRTYATLMTGRPVLEQVIADRGLQTDPAKLAKQISVTPQASTTILDVAVRDTDPARAKDMANTLVDDFIAKIKAIQKGEATAPTANSADNLVVWTRAV